MYRNDLINKKIEDQKEKGFSYGQVAKSLGLNINTLQKIRKGKEIRVGTLEKVATGLDIPICELFEKEPAIAE